MRTGTHGARRRARRATDVQRTPPIRRVARNRSGYDTAMTQAIIHTSEGDITVDLFEDKAPFTVQNFIALAEGSQEWRDPETGETRNDALYDNTTFHRIIKDFMIQGGDPAGNGTGGPGYIFDDEISDVKFDRPYLLAMANAGIHPGPDGRMHGTNGSQFFITTVPTPWLDGHHTIFGEVSDDDSKSVVDAIESVATDARDMPLEPVIIESIEVLED